MGVLDVPTSPNRYATRLRHLAGVLPRYPNVTPDVHAAPPTYTDSATATMTTNIHTVGCASYTEYTALGVVPAENLTFHFVGGDVGSNAGAGEMQFGFVLAGDEVEIQLRATAAFAGQRLYIWVDGKPITAGPQTPVLNSVASGGSLFLKLAFGAVGLYNIKVYTGSFQLVSIVIPVAQGVSPLMRNPLTVGIVGDSWGATNSVMGYLTLDAFPRWTGIALGAEIIQGCMPGTGYIKGGATSQPYGDSLRVAAMVALRPDLLLITAGGNDFDQGTKTQITAAATALYATYAAAIPKAPIIVGGVFPNNIANFSTQLFVDCANAVRNAAVASPYVSGFFDPLGIADTGVIPATAHAVSTAYTVGQRVTYKGDYIECVEAHTSSGSSPSTPTWNRWKSLSWLNGTGHAGSTTGDGNRDSFLGSDQGHPNAIPGSRWFGQRVAGEVIRILAGT